MDPLSGVNVVAGGVYRYMTCRNRSFILMSDGDSDQHALSEITYQPNGSIVLKPMGYVRPGEVTERVYREVTEEDN